MKKQLTLITLIFSILFNLFLLYKLERTGRIAKEYKRLLMVTMDENEKTNNYLNERVLKLEKSNDKKDSLILRFTLINSK